MKTISNLIIACFIIVFSGCIKKDKDNPTPVDNSVTSMPMQFTGTIDNVKLSFVAPTNGKDEENVSKSNYLPGLNEAIYSFAITDSNNRKFTFSTGVLVYDATQSKPLDSEFKYYFTSKNYNYGSMAFLYTDADGYQWDSTLDTQVQSDFKITELKEDTHHGNYALKFRAEFNCKVYRHINPNDPTSQLVAKNIENGVLVGYFENK